MDAARGLNVLLLLLYSINIHPFLLPINASAYANLKHEEAAILINIIKNLRISALSFLQTKLYKSFLYHRIQSKIFRLEMWSDEEILAELLDSAKLRDAFKLE
jgi:hypothetical protein